MIFAAGDRPVVTFADVRDARLGPLAEAAQAWHTTSKAFAELEGRCAVEVTGFLRGSGWAGPAAGEVLRRADELDDEFEIVSMQARTAAAVLRNAAEQFQGVRRRLLAAIDGAAAAGLRVDDDGRAHPQAMTYAERHDPDADLAHRQAMDNARIYTDLIARIVDEATDADRGTARALRALTPAMPGQFPWEYNKATDAAQAAAAALGLDESDLPAPGSAAGGVRDWWNGLSADQRQVLLTAYPEQLGELDGLPAVDRDYANQLALRNYIGDNVNHYRDHDNPQHDRALTLLDKLEAAETAPPHKRLYLLTIDPIGDAQAAVAIGNPDTADHTAVLIPGVGTELDDIRGQISHTMTRFSNRSTTKGARAAVAVAVACLLAACVGGPEEEPLQNKPKAEISRLAQSRAQAIADVVGRPLENWRTNTSPCIGRHGETAEDGRWTLTGFAGMSVPPDEQLAALARVREMWQQHGYEITENRTFADGTRGAASVRDPDTDITISLMTTMTLDRIALILAAGCYLPVNGEDPAND